MKGFNLFGVSFERADSNERNISSPIAVDNNGATVIQNTPGFISPRVNIFQTDITAKSEADYIQKYRETATTPEVSQCIDEIVSEAIIIDRNKDTVTIDMDEVPIPDNIKKKVEECFQHIYRVLKFNKAGYDIFRRWYIDGRLNYYTIVDEDDMTNGIKAVKYIDPRKIKKIKEVDKKKDADTGVTIVQKYIEYYLYNEKGFDNTQNSSGQAVAFASQANDVVLTADSVVHCNSGIFDNAGIALSYLQDVIRPANNLRMMEDSMVIYRLVRAPERRVFYIDTGNLPNIKAQQYVQEIANQYKNKIVYDVNSGEIKNDRKFLAMSEDYWIPRKEGSRGTQIETLPGGQQLGETGEAEWFKDKTYAAMKVPKSRFTESQSMFTSGSQITRDELRFNRHIIQLRTKFNTLFTELLGRQIVLTGVMSLEEYDYIKDDIQFNYAADNMFAESLESDLMSSRAAVLNLLDPFVGKYLSREYIYKNVLRMTDEEMEDEKKKVEEDIKKYGDPALIAQGITPDAQAQPTTESLSLSIPHNPNVDRLNELVEDILTS